MEKISKKKKGKKTNVDLIERRMAQDDIWQPGPQWKLIISALRLYSFNESFSDMKMDNAYSAIKVLINEVKHKST